MATIFPPHIAYLVDCTSLKRKLNIHSSRKQNSVNVLQNELLFKGVYFGEKVHDGDGGKYFSLITFFYNNEYFPLFGDDSEKYVIVFGIKKENIFQIYNLK